MRFRVVTGSPVPEAIGDVCEELARRSGASITSGYRGDKAASLLKRLGKATQRMLYNGWVRRLPGFHPANPPNQSTHECFSDGVPYRGPVGRALFDWQCGTDWSDSTAVLIAAKHLGVAMARPYSDPREAHHLNFTRRPKYRKVRPLDLGSRGPRVGRLTGRLAYLGYDIEKMGRYTHLVAREVRHFQARHDHLADDGIAGHATEAQLKMAVRGKKRCRKRAGRIKSRAERVRALDACDLKFGPVRKR